MTAAAAREFVSRLAENPHTHSEVKPALSQLRNYHEKKLWHQLTVALEDLVKSPHFEKAEDLVGLYEHFIRDFETKLNQLSLAKIIVQIARRIADPAAAVQFLDAASSRINKNSEKEAFAFARSSIALLRLRQGQLDDAKQEADVVSAVLESVTGVEAVVYSAYYRVLSDYYKAKVSPTEFYKNTMLYLSYTSLDTVPLVEQQTLAVDLALAALVSTDIYNFGELLAHPILKTLEGTKPAWLVKLLYTVNAGQIDQFEAICSASSAEIATQPALMSNQGLLREKITMLALVELVFGRPSRERALPFSLIAEKTKLRVDEVELMLMRTFSLKLARGEIDEVNQTVNISWIQPRTLDMTQISKMRDAVSDWATNVHEVLTFVQNEASAEIFA